MLAHTLRTGKTARLYSELADPGLSEERARATQKCCLRATGGAHQGCPTNRRPVDGCRIKLTRKSATDLVQVASFELKHRFGILIKVDLGRLHLRSHSAPTTHSIRGSCLDKYGISHGNEEIHNEIAEPHRSRCRLKNRASCRDRGFVDHPWFLPAGSQLPSCGEGKFAESRIQKEKPHQKAGLIFTVFGYGKSERDIVVHFVEAATCRCARTALRAAASTATRRAAGTTAAATAASICSPRPPPPPPP
ncbi:hypothetical protein CSX04_00366 [Burkholderia cepacia]|nr:hypothetical protein CSX04_00366 [Burkholderia cepacia]